jgi:hypothetical protein
MLIAVEKLNLMRTLDAAVVIMLWQCGGTLFSGCAQYDMFI